MEVTVQYTEWDCEQAIDDMPDGRGVVVKQLHPEVPVGKIYACKGNGVYWLKKKLGLVHHTSRGVDKTPRAIAASKTLAARYYEQTGRRVDLEMEQEQLMVQAMVEAASQIEDPSERFSALEKATAAQSRFNKTWLPFLEQKLGTLQSTQTLEEKQSMDDLLTGVIDGD